MFARPKTPWPCETVKTGFAARQPTLVAGPDGELLANAYCSEGPGLVHSTDGGLTWSLLCEVPLDTSGARGQEILGTNWDGVGVTESGTLLCQYTVQSNDGRNYEGWPDESYWAEMRIMRSADRGRTWEGPIGQDVAPFNCNGTGRARFARLPGGVVAIAMETWQQTRPDDPTPRSEWCFRAFLYTSSDDGRTWEMASQLCKHGCEADLLPLPSGRLLASVRYQRTKLPGDPAELVNPETKSSGVASGSVYKQTALVCSDDGGNTWSHPRLLTGWLQQSACLARLSDGTVILPFGEKTESKGQRFGQRFMVSYDEGKTWSRTVYELNRGGLYASSVVLPDDTIVTVHDNRATEAGVALAVLRWRAPSREEVSKGGFFEPQPVDV